MYSMDQLNELPDGVRPDQVATRTTGDTLLFFDKESPFSNYHPSGFIVDNIHYTCNEQFYQSKKAEHFNGHDTASKIMKTDNPYTYYNQGKLIKNVNKEEWYSCIKDHGEGTGS